MWESKSSRLLKTLSEPVPQLRSPQYHSIKFIPPCASRCKSIANGSSKVAPHWGTSQCQPLSVRRAQTISLELSIASGGASLCTRYCLLPKFLVSLVSRAFLSSLIDFSSRQLKNISLKYLQWVSRAIMEDGVGAWEVVVPSDGVDTSNCSLLPDI